jgi:hypothetical protein
MEVAVPDLAKSKPFKDFGQGFYLSADKGQAMRMAEQKTLLMMTGEPTVTEFDFDESLLQSGELSVKVFEDYSVEWATFILKNRDIHEKHPTHDYDIVFGPIADDGVTYQLRRHQSGAISIEELVRELKYARGITFQYFFGTPVALSKLTKL